MSVRIHVGDALTELAKLPSESVHCCVTSPPYWGLRSYQGDPGMIGLEPTFDEHLENLVAVFREVRRVLRQDGTLWLNYGDAHANSGLTGRADDGESTWSGGPVRGCSERVKKPAHGLKPKDLMMMPARVAMALQKPFLQCRGCGNVAHETRWGRFPNGRRICPGCVKSKGADVETPGWWLRSEIIWCLSGGTWLYARTDTKPPAPRMLKDLVRLDPATVQLWTGERWTRVTHWVRSTDPETKTEIVLRSGERIGCTGRHVWPTTNRGEVHAEDLAVGDTLQRAQLPDESPCPAWLTADALWFAGLYLAEGSRSGTTIQIAGHVSESKRWDRIQTLCFHYGASARRYEYGNSQHIAIDVSAALRAVLATTIVGAGAKTKGLNPHVWGWSNQDIGRIITGYLDGDGSAQGSRVRLGFTRNYRLERDLRCAAARLGATITLKPTFAAIGEKRYPAFRGEWRWGRSGHWNEKDRGEIVELRRSRARTFWDISVEDPCSLFALASGIVSHNSKPNPMPESVRDRPTSSHEKMYLMSRSAKYFYDADAVRVPALRAGDIAGGRRSFEGQPNPVSGEVPPTANLRNVLTIPDMPEKERTDKQRGYGRRHAGFNDRWDGMTKEEQQAGGSAMRNVIRVATHSFKGAHFATFPPKLVEPCIKAGTSEAGCCAQCGAGWVRVVEKQFTNLVTKSMTRRAPVDEDTRKEIRRYLLSQRNRLGLSRRDVGKALDLKEMYGWYEGHPSGSQVPGIKHWMILKDVLQLDDRFDVAIHATVEVQVEVAASKSQSADPNVKIDFSSGGESHVWTKGWRPTCDHDAAAVPCTVLDPFAGAGTTGLVASRLGRAAVLVEISGDYARMARKRIEDDCPMFAGVTLELEE